MKWISVKDPPEEGVFVLICNALGGWGVGFLDDGEWICLSGFLRPALPITKYAYVDTNESPDKEAGKQ